MRRRTCRLGLCLMAAGCGGDARVELSAADALGAVAGQMERTIGEYHAEVAAYDDARESGVVAAFVSRVRRDAADEAAMSAHAVEFEAALRKIRGDREVEWSRRSAAMDNVAALREVSRGLQKLAIQSLSLQDEMKRYLQGWIDLRRQQEAREIRPAGTEPRAEGGAERARPPVDAGAREVDR